MAAQMEIEDQESVTNLDDGKIFDSDDADSRVLPHLVGIFSGEDSTVLLGDHTAEYGIIRNCFLSGMGPFASKTTIVALRKNYTERVTTKARFAAFRVFTEAMARRNGGDANVKYGWYSDSKEEIDSIVSYGFSSHQIEKFEKEHICENVANTCSK